MGQLSFYSASAIPRALSDLEGVLCARGQVVMFGRGTTARLSVVLGSPSPAEPEDAEGGHDQPEDAGGGHGEFEDAGGGQDEHDDAGEGHGGREFTRSGAIPTPDPADLEFLDLEPAELAAILAGPVAGLAVTAGAAPFDAVTAAATATRDPVAEWRARVLRCAFRGRGVEAELDRAPDGRPVVRSAFRADLVDLARRWTRGAVKAVPSDLELDGPRLRLWVLVAGRRVGRAYVLGLDPHAEHTHDALLTASRRAGLGATLGGDRADPVLRIVGRRRQGRLGELVGDPPHGLPEGVWPA